MKYSQTDRKRKWLFPLAFLCLLGAFFFGILLGGTPLSVLRLLDAVRTGETQSPDLRIFLYVRLPRTLGALLAGGALALSGAVIQGVLGNRLASPGVIGVNAGAGFAVTLASAFGILGGFRLSLFAFLGALLSVMIVSIGARRMHASRGTVILMGVALNSILGALSDTVVTFAPSLLSTRNAFRLGDFSGVSYPKLLPAGCLILLAAAVLFTLSNELDVLTLGEENAVGLGQNTRLMRPLLLTLAAVLAGAAVSYAGLLSFVGLLVPHAVRRFSGDGARRLLPLSFLFGAAFVAFADTLSRVLLAPYEIPVGIPIALIGAPFFLVLLFRRKEGDGHA